MCLVMLIAANNGKEISVFMGSDNHVIKFKDNPDEIKDYIDLISREKEVYDVGSKIIMLNSHAALCYGSTEGKKHRHILPYEIAETNYSDDPQVLIEDVIGLSGFLYTKGKAFYLKNGKFEELNISPPKGEFYVYIETMPYCKELAGKIFNDYAPKTPNAQTCIFNTIKKLNIMTNGLIGSIPHIVKFNERGEYQCIL